MGPIRLEAMRRCKTAVMVRNSMLRDMQWLVMRHGMVNHRLAVVVHFRVRGLMVNLRLGVGENMMWLRVSLQMMTLSVVPSVDMLQIRLVVMGKFRVRWQVMLSGHWLMNWFGVMGVVLELVNWLVV